MILFFSHDNAVYYFLTLQQLFIGWWRLAVGLAVSYTVPSLSIQRGMQKNPHCCLKTEGTGCSPKWHGMVCLMDMQ